MSNEKKGEEKNQTEKKAEEKKRSILNLSENTRILIERMNDDNSRNRKIVDALNYDYVKNYNLDGIEKFRLKSNVRLFDNISFDKQIELENEINDLKKKLRTLSIENSEVNSNKNQIEEKFNKTIEELQSKQKINHILPRICEEAKEKLLTEQSFRDLFRDGKSCDSVVVSIDIRRSTELMLKARKPELFSKFITQLSQELSEIILTNFGIFDKFTGDGILAFFPKFYSGEHAIIRALKAAEECHKKFELHYKKSRECFNVFIKDVGLGIGIDYGSVTLVNTSNELTVVGIPVVYACRMGGANAGQTLLNQPAMEEIVRLSSNYIKVIETEINIKNEGLALAYMIEMHNSSFNVTKPEWTFEEKDKVEEKTETK